MTTVDDAIRDAYKARAERIDIIRYEAAVLARDTHSPDVSRLATLINELAAEVQ